MKIKTLIFLFCMTFISSTHALNYTINFAGSGSSSTVDSVIVQNLSKKPLQLWERVWIYISLM